MNFFNIAVLINPDNYVGGYSRVDDADLEDVIYISTPKQLAPLILSEKHDRPMYKDKYLISRYLHTDGNTYLIGKKCDDSRNHEYADVIELAKGNKSNGVYWM